MYENVDDYYFCKKMWGKGGWKVSRGGEEGGEGKGERRGLGVITMGYG